MAPYQENTGAPAPKEPHLGLMVTDGTITAIPKGAIMAVIINPHHVDGVIPMILAKVTRQKLEFLCGCGKYGSTCTRKMVYRLEKAGHHPPSQQFR